MDNEDLDRLINEDAESAEEGVGEPSEVENITENEDDLNNEFVNYLIEKIEAMSDEEIMTTTIDEAWVDAAWLDEDWKKHKINVPTNSKDIKKERKELHKVNKENEKLAKEQQKASDIEYNKQYNDGNSRVAVANANITKYSPDDVKRREKQGIKMAKLLGKEARYQSRAEGNGFFKAASDGKAVKIAGKKEAAKESFAGENARNDAADAIRADGSGSLNSYRKNLDAEHDREKAGLDAQEAKIKAARVQNKQEAAPAVVKEEADPVSEETLEVNPAAEEAKVEFADGVAEPIAPEVNEVPEPEKEEPEVDKAQDLVADADAKLDDDSVGVPTDSAVVDDAPDTSDDAITESINSIIAILKEDKEDVCPAADAKEVKANVEAETVEKKVEAPEAAPVAGVEKQLKADEVVKASEAPEKVPAEAVKKDLCDDEAACGKEPAPAEITESQTQKYKKADTGMSHVDVERTYYGDGKDRHVQVKETSVDHADGSKEVLKDTDEPNSGKSNRDYGGYRNNVKKAPEKEPVANNEAAEISVSDMVSLVTEAAFALKKAGKAANHEALCETVEKLIDNPESVDISVDDSIKMDPEDGEKSEKIAKEVEKDEKEDCKACCDDVKPVEIKESVHYGSIKEACALDEYYFNMDSYALETADEKFNKLTEQVSLLIARENNDPMYNELLKEAVYAKRLQEAVCNKYHNDAVKKAEVISRKKELSECFTLEPEELNEDSLEEGAAGRWFTRQAIRMMTDKGVNKVLEKARAQAVAEAKTPEDKEKINQKVDELLKMEKKAKKHAVIELLKKAPESEQNKAEAALSKNAVVEDRSLTEDVNDVVSTAIGGATTTVGINDLVAIGASTTKWHSLAITFMVITGLLVAGILSYIIVKNVKKSF